MDRPTQRRRGGVSVEPRTKRSVQRRPSAGADGQWASPVHSSVQCLKHKVQRRRPARTWYNPHELRELRSRGPHPICMYVYYVAIPLHDRGTSGSGQRNSWTPTTKTSPRISWTRKKTCASGSPGSLAGLTAGPALVLQPRVSSPPTWHSPSPPTWLRTSMSMTWGSAMPMATAIASVSPVGR